MKISAKLFLVVAIVMLALVPISGASAADRLPGETPQQFCNRMNGVWQPGQNTNICDYGEDHFDDGRRIHIRVIDEFAKVGGDLLKRIYVSVEGCFGRNGKELANEMPFCQRTINLLRRNNPAP